MAFDLVVVLMAVALDVGFPDGPVCPFDLTIRPVMARLGELVLNAIGHAHAVWRPGHCGVRAGHRTGHRCW